MERFSDKVLHDCEHGKMNRRQLIQSLALAATAASTARAGSTTGAGSQVFKAVRLDHISYQVADYVRSRDFYAGLFGLPVTVDDPEKKLCHLLIGDTTIVLRTRTPAGLIDHICFTLTNWDSDKNVRNEVRAELAHRGLAIREMSEGSLFIKDPDGFDLQLGGTYK